MRIWNVNPEKLCRQHLLGEHVESHMFVGCIRKKKSLKGYLERGLVEIHNLRKRHDVLAREMEERGMKHKSRLPEFKAARKGKVDARANKKELARRCGECKALLRKRE